MTDRTVRMFRCIYCRTASEGGTDLPIIRLTLADLQRCNAWLDSERAAAVARGDIDRRDIDEHRNDRAAQTLEIDS